MRVLSMIAFVLMLWAPTLVRAADDQKTEKPVTQACMLKVSGMTCAGCEAAVRMAAKSVDGVKTVKVSYEKGNAELTYDPAKTTPDAIAKVITEKSGYKAEPVRTTAKK
jgi:copper chaperone CopZ